MRNKTLFLLFLTLCAVDIILSYSEEIFDTQNTHNQKLTVQLPINWTSSAKCSLSILIPDGYRPLQTIDSWEQSPILEFIPEKESDNDWTEIITLNKLIGQNIAAGQMIEYLKKTLPTKSSDFKVIDSSSTETASYQKANLEASYELEGVREILGCLYYSGPYDCCGIQYTIRLKAGQSEAWAVAKIKALFDSNTRTVGCDTYP